SAGAIDVHGNIEAGILLQFIQSIMYGLDGLILASKRDAQGWYHADGVFVDSLQNLFGVHDEAVALEWDLPQLDVEITSKLMPAYLHRPADEVGLVGRFALRRPFFTPLPLQGQPA